MENKGNKNPQSNMNQSAQGSSQHSNNPAQGSQQSNNPTGSSANQFSGASSSSQSSSERSTNQSGTSGKSGLDNITSKLQQFGNSTMEKVNGLSTTQKVVGGSLLALGAGWVAMNSKNKNKIKNLGSKIADARKSGNKSSDNRNNNNPNRRP